VESRPTVSGGHVAVERAVGAQFGATFAPHGRPRRPGNEVEAALEVAEAIITAAEKLLPHLTLCSG
jgi:hypothetical protein